jgi:hypothetical protein
MQYVPAVDSNQRPLMPTTSKRAECWIESGKATPFFRKGIFCVRLNVEPSDRHTQPVAVGIEPGSKREGYTVKSKAHTYLNQKTYAAIFPISHIGIEDIKSLTKKGCKT